MTKQDALNLEWETIKKLSDSAQAHQDAKSLQKLATQMFDHLHSIDNTETKSKIKLLKTYADDIARDLSRAMTQAAIVVHDAMMERHSNS